MERFLVFAGCNYYPSGGIHDLIGNFDDIKLAVRAADQDVEFETTRTKMEYDWAHIFDSELGETVCYRNNDGRWAKPGDGWIPTLSALKKKNRSIF